MSCILLSFFLFIPLLFDMAEQVIDLTEEKNPIPQPMDTNRYQWIPIDTGLMQCPKVRSVYQPRNRTQLTAAKAIPTYCRAVSGFPSNQDHHTARSRLLRTCAAGNCVAGVALVIM